jgi:hypothetical protein
MPETKTVRSDGNTGNTEVTAKSIISEIPRSRVKICIYFEATNVVAYLGEALYYKPYGHGFDPDVFIRLFNFFNPSSRNNILGWTWPVSEMSTRNFSGGKGLPEHKADNLTAICQPIF